MDVRPTRKGGPHVSSLVRARLVVDERLLAPGAELEDVEVRALDVALGLNFRGAPSTDLLMFVCFRALLTSVRVALLSAHALLMAAMTACAATYMGGPKFETNFAL